MSVRRRGPYFKTYTGRTFWPMDPRPDEISILDIAHSLAHQCRFSGHTREFYSVAEHSVRVSQIVPSPYQLWALLHDAAEAYLLDWPRPLKQSGLMGWLYRRAERRLMRVIYQRFGLDATQPECVGLADQILLATEQRDLFGKLAQASNGAGVPLPEKITPLAPAEAKAAYLQRFQQLHPMSSEHLRRNQL
jgi:5'-deoxynucleotidase YfbR-like HD superfamily hydrolase